MLQEARGEGRAAQVRFKLLAQHRLLGFPMIVADCLSRRLPHMLLRVQVTGMLDPDGNGKVDAVLRDAGTFNPLDARGSAGLMFRSYSAFD